MSAGAQWHRLLALAWLVIVTAVAWHQYHLWKAPDFATDVAELLPRQDDAVLSQATAELLSVATTQWVVLVGASDWEASKAAATQLLPLLDPQRDKLQDTAQGAALSDALMRQVVGARGALVTHDARQWLASAPDEAIARRALQHLVQPVGDGFASWRDDPLGLLGEWVRERAQWSRLRPRDGWLWVEDGGIQWVALPFAEGRSGFAGWNAGENSVRLAAARELVAGLDSDVRLLAAGTPLLAEAAASRAVFEMSVIGTGSLLAVVLLTLVAFGSVRPILLVLLSLLVGCAAALSVTSLVFGRVHLLTTVFGASLIGVAEDYGVHYFVARRGAAVARRWEQLRGIAPGLWLALLTSLIAYLALGLAPFPGLRQIAVFSCVGLLAAFLTVYCWFPWLDRKPIPVTRPAAAFARSLDRWPRWPAGRRGWWLGAACLLLLLPGLARLHAVDDLRLLQNIPGPMLEEQVEVSRILGLASPAQFFIVSGDDGERMLQAEEALVARLAPLAAGGVMSGYQALSDWVPSQRMQVRSSALVAHADEVALRAVQQATGQVPEGATTPSVPLAIGTFREAAGGAIPIPTWQDEAGRHHTLVMLQGVGRASLGRLAAAADGLAGVVWVDNTARYSGVLAHYRVLLGSLLLVGVAAVALLLHGRHGARAWRAYVPTLFGGVATLAIFGWAGVPLQLFVVLSLILLLGMGIDYGIFLMEHPGEHSVWLAVAIAGVTTLLSFGLLALSSTPALRAFGLGMLVGEIIILLLTPVFRQQAATVPVTA